MQSSETTGRIGEVSQERKEEIDNHLNISLHTTHPDDSKTIVQLRTTIELIARLLEYPSERMIDDSISKEKLEAIVPQAEIRRGILRFLIAAKKKSVSKLRAKYVSLFDFSDKTTLNLTYHIFGEERDRTHTAQRGAALLLLKSVYSGSGFQPNNIELSDYLPMALEFVAMAPKDQGVKVAELIKEPMAVLQRNLKEGGTGECLEYASLLDACTAALNEFVSSAKSTREGNSQ